MKSLAVLVLAFAVIAATVIGYQAAKARVAAPQAEACMGLNCLPPDLLFKHRPAHRDTLPPVW
jgi:hypothetical protein